MKKYPQFLIAARRCEIADLEQLATTSALVGSVSRLIHSMQKERGISNIFLGSRGTRFGDQLRQQVDASQISEQQLVEHLNQLDTDAASLRNGARLFSRIARVLHSLEALPALRQRVSTLALPAEEATGAFIRLVSGMLALVFEAADNASDPEISRALVAMFNFMQGKEFAGQERALGANAFACGHIDTAGRQLWAHLIASQEQCEAAFIDQAHAEIVQAWQASRSDGVLAQLERMRRTACVPSALDTLDPNQSLPWYEACTARIDRMRDVEDLQEQHLRLLCERRVAQARAELHDQQTMLDHWQSELNDQLKTQSAEGTVAPLGPHLERSIVTMMQEQSHRLQAMGQELETVRSALQERKVVERAKGVLMAATKISEPEAHKMLRQAAMNQNKRLIEVAEAVLTMADLLPS